MNYALVTDFYELVMMQGYLISGRHPDSVFDMYFRREPFSGGFAIFAGLEPLVKAILDLRFDEDDIAYLRSLDFFKDEFLGFLKDFRFRGSIYAAPEGTVVFPNEPLMRVTGSIIECQLLESMILNFINFQTLIASKAARISIASSGGQILEFGLRRAQGVDGSVSAARASFIGGAHATSNVYAGKKLGIPVRGTMAHSWVMGFPSELEAFKKFAEIYPDNSVLLVDTYDTLKSGVPNAVKVFKDLKKKGIKNFAIRLDSGDLEFLSKEARKIFDENDLPETKIFASNDLDEWIIKQLVEHDSPIDVWGVGTRLVTGDTDPALTGVYKLAAKKEGRKYAPCIKISNNLEKITNPGIKGVYRFYDNNGKMAGDLIYLVSEGRELFQRIENREKIRFNHPSIDYSHFDMERYSRGEILLQEIVKNGELSYDFPTLAKIQKNVRDNLNNLDSTYKRFLNPHIYKISLSSELNELKRSLLKKNNRS